jgi:N-acetyl sugar amidotransferase
MPDTRPDTHFADGQCSACRSFAARSTVDWGAGMRDLIRTLEMTPRNGTGYDCIVPSSGGKDSHWQVLTLIELGVRPLVVTATTCMLTDIGRQNIDNLASYATTVEVTPKRDVRAKLNRAGLTMVGDISWPEHVSIFTVPFQMAATLGIPAIWYGECPQREYGGPVGTDEARVMTRRWVAEFGGFLGLRAADMVGVDGITEADMRDYMLPDDDRLAGVTAYFLGQYMPWDSHRNAKVAVNAGMKTQLPTAANWWDFENLDNAMAGLHDYFGWLKYGYGRASVQLSVDIRNGRIGRDAALAIAERRDGVFPDPYMGVGLGEILSRIGMSPREFGDVCNQFSGRSRP